VVSLSRVAPTALCSLALFGLDVVVSKERQDCRENAPFDHGASDGSAMRRNGSIDLISIESIGVMLLWRAAPRQFIALYGIHGECRGGGRVLREVRC
jgi:hypothetical protein